jgi:DNA-binding MurR/RpiR family transcriptional regulator
VLVLTGARSPIKKQTLAVVQSAKRAGAKVLTLTDGNDPEVARHSAMTLFLPPLDEITGAILAHAVMAWTVYEASRLSLVGRRPEK